MINPYDMTGRSFRIIQIEEKVDASRAAKMNKELEIYYQWYDAKGGTLPGFQ